MLLWYEPRRNGNHPYLPHQHQPKETDIPSNITVIAAGTADQIASWGKDKFSGLFTKYFLKGMSGEADAKPYGNGDGKVVYEELGRYLKGTLRPDSQKTLVAPVIDWRVRASGYL